MVRDALGGSPFASRYDEWGVDASTHATVPTFRTNSSDGPNTGLQGLQGLHDPMWAEEASLIMDAHRTAPPSGTSLGPDLLVQLAFSDSPADAAYARSMSAVLFALVRDGRGREHGHATQSALEGLLPSPGPGGRPNPTPTPTPPPPGGRPSPTAFAAASASASATATAAASASAAPTGAPSTFHLPSDEPQRCLRCLAYGPGYRFPGTQLDDQETPPEGFRCRLDGSGAVGQLTGSRGNRSTAPVLSTALLCHYHHRKHRLDPAMLLELAHGLHNGSITEINL